MKKTIPPKRQVLPALLLLIVGACGGQSVEEPSPVESEDGDGESAEVQEQAEEVAPPDRTRAEDPAVEPRVAMLAGLMPRASTGVDEFLQRHPEYDGRAVVIGILDSGIDAGLPGFHLTTTDKPKILDLRDFSEEGRISLREVTPAPDGTIDVNGQVLTGFGTVAAIASPPYYGGTFRELPLGEFPGSDVNGNDEITDEFPVLAVRTSSGWAVVTDTDNDFELSDETPIHDYAVAAETFTYSHKEGEHGEGPLTIAVNFSEADREPILDLFFDSSGHGSHVAGIAAGHDMFGVEGFDGIAPGAQILGVKIANNARGGITVTGSMVRAMNYAADYAQQRGLPLVLNMSFGVGNDAEGMAAIDSLVDEFALKRPQVFFVISAGNDGPGISTMGFPGSAEHIVSVCALFPGVFSGPRPPGFATDSDVLAAFSARGGELGKPDVCAPGAAYSNVPPWQLGEELAAGTSMAAPQISGAGALLQSAMVQNGRVARAVDLKQAMIASARTVAGATAVDMGAGVPNVLSAFAWLMAGHQAGLYSIRALPDGGNLSIRDAAYRRSGLESRADTMQRFEVRSVSGQPAARLLLKSDQRWLRAPESIELAGIPETVTVTYDASRLRTPGLYVGSVWATPASDTLAGPAFKLTNTVIVPISLELPFVEGRDMGPGRIRRYFFDVPADAGGLTVEMEPRYRSQRGSLYLFEPSGQPFRNGSTEDAGGSDPPTATMTIRGDDVVPGIYEVIVAAPPSSALSYDVRVALPRYSVDDVGTGPSAVIRNYGDQADSVGVTAQLIGAVKTLTVHGQGSTPKFIPVDIPNWADELIVDIRLPPGAWNEFTDLGLTVFDSTGEQVSQGPLSYGFGRHPVDLNRSHRGQRLQVELFPGFAHLKAPETWEADVRIVLTMRSPEELYLLGADSTNFLELEPGQSKGVQFTPLSGDPPIPEGYEPLIEVTASPGTGYRRLEVFANPAAAGPAIRHGTSN